MRIQKLTVCNVGTFRGSHTFDLSSEPSKPVVLIGGRNGAGKTTVLEAIQWALFGRLVNTPRRDKANRGSYSQYLRHLIHRGKRSSEDSFVELHLLLRQSQADAEVVVRRKIKGGAKCTDELTVLINSEYLQLPEDQWPGMIDAILPSTLSQLYLFDGEQIESLADPEKSSEFLKTGIHALLGVDLIDQLSADLVTLRRKELSSIPNTGQNHQEDQLKRSIFEKQIQDADQKKTSLLEDLAELRVILDNSEKSAHDAEVVFKKSGAELYESHIEREAEIRLLDVRHSTIEEELRGLANGTAPLCFLKADILQYAQIASEHKSLEQKIAVRAALKNGIVELESWLSQKDCPKSALALIKEFRSLNLEGEECCSEELNLNVRSLQQANALVSDDGLKKDINYIHTLLEQLDDIEEEASALQKANELALSKEDAEGARNVYEESIKHLATSNATFKATEEQYNKSVLELEQATKQYDQFLQGIQLDQHDGFKAMRFSEACEKAKDSLIAFRKTVVLENAERIEARIWDRFKQLLRKKRLGYGVKIDPVNYTLSLLDKSGEVIPSERLSAGERQLLATAMLWGLADSSSMQLPVIIDTPLGRLDRKHRANLVSEYFPNASQQVVLLSTDEEIDERWLPVLEPSLARMYLIDFDDDQQCSTVVEGYFELELTHA